MDEPIFKVGDIVVLKNCTKDDLEAYWSDGKIGKTYRIKDIRTHCETFFCYLEGSNWHKESWLVPVKSKVGGEFI